MKPWKCIWIPYTISLYFWNLRISLFNLSDLQLEFCWNKTFSLLFLFRRVMRKEIKTPVMFVSQVDIKLWSKCWLSKKQAPKFPRMFLVLWSHFKMEKETMSPFAVLNCMLCMKNVGILTERDGILELQTVSISFVCFQGKVKAVVDFY